MFREMRRKKQAMAGEECIALLKEETRGVLSVLGDDNYPYGVPINHWYEEETGKLFFHGGKIGHRVDAVKKHDKVSFCVYDKGFQRAGEWALNVRCVIIFGRAVPVEDTERAMEISRKLSYKFTTDEEYIREEIRRSGPATLVYEIVIEHMTGKWVNEA